MSESQYAATREPGAPSERGMHSIIQGVEARMIVVRGSDYTVAGYTAAWADWLGWDRDEFVNCHSLDIGFLPDYADGATAENLASLPSRFEFMTNAAGGFNRPVVAKDGRELLLHALAARWRFDGDEVYYAVIATGRDRMTPRDVLDHAHSIVEATTSRGRRRPDTSDTTETRHRVAVRIDRHIAAAVQDLAREQGVTLNGLVQALIEGLIAAHGTREELLDGSDMGFSLGLGKAAADYRIARARAIDYDRRMPGSAPD